MWDTREGNSHQSRMALWSSGRHLASGSVLSFESWLCKVNVESLGKALYMHFPHPTDPCVKRVPDYRQYARVMRHLQ